MADVEDGRSLARVDLSVAARVTGIAAVVLGAAEFLNLAANFSITQAAYAVLGADGFFWIFEILWIIKVAATAVAAAGLIVGWRQAPLLWTPGVGQVALGLVLSWGWWAVNHYVDVWHFERFTGVDPADPDYLNTLRAAEWVNVAVPVVSVALLLSGGIRLLVRARSARH